MKRKKVAPYVVGVAKSHAMLYVVTVKCYRFEPYVVGVAKPHAVFVNKID